MLMLLGLLLISIGVAIFSKAELGYDPFMVFGSGVAKTFGLPLGLAHMFINLILLLAYIVCGKMKYINVGTLLALGITGPLINVFTELIGIALSGEIELIVRIGLLPVACLLMGLGLYLYTGVRLGAGPNDLVSVILRDMTQKPLGLVRVLVDGLWTIAGVFLGGSVGLGTLTSLFFVGISVQLWSKLGLFAKYMPKKQDESRK